MDLPAVEPRARGVGHSVSSIAFTFYSSDEVRKMSVQEITLPICFDELGRPISGSLYDPRLGTTSHRDLCATCSLGYQECPGHFGHIELAAPLMNPFLFGLAFKVLRAKCWFCNRFRLPAAQADLFLAKFRALDAAEPELASKITTAIELRKAFSDDARNTDESGQGERAAEMVRRANQAWNDTKRDREDGVSRRGQDWTQAVDDFLKACQEKTLQCHRCGATGVKLRKDGDMKVYRSISKTGASSNRASGHVLQTLSSAGQEAQSNEEDDADQATANINDENENSSSTRIVLSVELEQQLRALWKNERSLCDLLFGGLGRPGRAKSDKALGHEVFFVKVLSVPPSRFRPPAKTDEGEAPKEHPQNYFLGRILLCNQQLRDGEKKDKDNPLLRKVKLVVELQQSFNQLLDSNQSANMGRPGSVPTGIKQQLEHKEGLFRMHMMGKRVNYSARSVIGPDPFLDTTEIGIPLSFAKKLTVPVPVNSLNIDELRAAVEKGPEDYPGACFVEEGTTGMPMRLRPDREHQRHAQAMLLDKGLRRSGKSGLVDVERKRVFRHLKTGDIVLFNRQPSLHRASIMAHRVRILPGERTLRMHYANCGAYNADFDGDEMNVHLPQDEISRAEAEQIVLADRQYITPTSGGPLRGLIQDHVVAGVLLTKRDTFLKREMLHQLFYGACEFALKPGERVRTPIPAILAPVQLWTGKQLISMVLDTLRTSQPMSLVSKSRTKADVIGKEECQVVVLSGDLIQGILDKKQFGAADHGLVHAFYECYGAEAAGKLLSAFGRLFTLYLRFHAHTTGIDDLLLATGAEERRREILDTSRRLAGRIVAAKVTKGDQYREDETPTPLEARDMVVQVLMESRADGEGKLDSGMKNLLSSSSTKVMDACFPHGLVKPFPKNGFQLMTATGAKGSAVNASQISCQLGQTELEGHRVPRSASGATLPCFAPFESSARAGGYISDRFLTGIKPPEFFLHCMAGREGLVDTAVKTARSGYLQRCLVKHMEGMVLAYDHTVRDSDGSVVQFVYGGDGLDACKTSWLLGQFDWQSKNSETLKQSNGVETNQDLPQMSKEVRKLRKALLSSDGDAAPMLFDAVGPGAPSRLGVVSEEFLRRSTDFCRKHPNHPKSKELETFFSLRYLRAVAEPGEAVGILAAQGVGEPSTQMTLNTFHFAGMGAAHVTLGIPRLRELLMTASKIPKTPTMKLFLKPGFQRGMADSLSRKLRRVTVRDLLEGIAVKDIGCHDGAHRVFRVRLQLPEPSLYCQALSLSVVSVADAVFGAFSGRVQLAVTMFSRKVLSGSSSKQGPLQSSHGANVEVNEEEPEEADVEDRRARKRARNDDESEAEEDEAGDGDATESRRARRQNDDAFYEDAEDDSVDDQEETKDTELNGEPGDTGEWTVDRLPQMASDIKQTVKLHNNRKPGRNFRASSEGRWLEFTVAVPLESWKRVMLPELVLNVAEKVTVREVPGINRCFVDEDPKTRELLLQTEGRNFVAAWDLGSSVDVNRIESNDIYGVLTTYGVEAAKATLEKELQFVFDAYGIGVDPRHLALIADHMMMYGEYRAFNRGSMDLTPSDFQKMSFETTVAFLTDAAIKSQSDRMQSPSSCISLGVIPKGGTGSFGLLQDLRVSG